MKGVSVHRPPDDHNPDDWDGTDHAEEFFEPEKHLASRRGQGACEDLEQQSLRNTPAPGPGYVDEQPIINAQIRAKAQYKCERCGIDLKECRHLLHVHHLDGNKLNNEPSNLIALCAFCHGDRDRHRHLVAELKPDDRAYLERLRKERGIS